MFLSRGNVSTLVFILLLQFVSTVTAALSEGYVLCGTDGGRTTYLLNGNGEVAYTWKHTTQSGYSMYLYDNGLLLRTTQVTDNILSGAIPAQGGMEIVDPSGKAVWSYRLADNKYHAHHDVKILPNGNILGCAFEVRSQQEIEDNHVEPSGSSLGLKKSILAEMIFELDTATKQIVWEWHIWDHVVEKEQAAAHPELFSGDLGPLLINQWVHLNGIDYCPHRNLIVFTSRLFSEVYVIDHSTTTSEAATNSGGNHGKGGAILYRWGKPLNYKMSEPTQVNCLHSPTWIPEGYPGEGNILFFHNNVTSTTMGRLGPSQVIELVLPLDSDGRFIRPDNAPFGPPAPSWLYNPGDDFHSGYCSSAMRMPNGNTFVHESLPLDGGNSRFREVASDGSVVWLHQLDLISDGSDMFGSTAFNPKKVMYYPDNHPGVVKLLAAGAAVCRKPRPNATPHVLVRGKTLTVTNAAGATLHCHTLQGKQIVATRLVNDRTGLYSTRLPPGVFIITIRDPENRLFAHTVTIAR
jgi:hypothetical protein